MPASATLRAGRLLAFLPRPLLEPRRPLVAILAGWLTAFLPSILLSALVAQLPTAVERPTFGVTGGYVVFLLVVFAPVGETLIMGAVLSLLLRWVSPAVAVIMSSLGWGLAHSAMAAAWGLVIWWPFLVFSTLFVTWRRRSLLLALAIPAAAHALHNLGPTLLLLYQFSV